jgi:phage baseplate assembly protein V
MNENISAMLMDIFRVGEVVETNPENCTVRVKFEDTDNLVSGNLQILKNKTLEDKDYSMHDIGEMVACIFLGNGSTSGFVLGAIYSDKDKPNENNQEVWAKEFKDGTKIRYDRKEHKLNIMIKGDAKIHVEKDKAIDVGGNLDIGSGIDINVGATGDLNVESSAANLNCPEINLGKEAKLGVVHEASPCPLYGICHLNPSQTTKTAP